MRFQSSPALTGGCYQSRRARSSRTSSFNPHPPLRADAIPAQSYLGSAEGTVSILTRPYGRMLWSPICSRMLLSLRFQSSPALTGGCYGAISCGCSLAAARFNPHPPLRADAMAEPGRPGQPHTVSILTRPYGRMLYLLPPPRGGCRTVSILTRPYGRMLCHTLPRVRACTGVSILTRPYGRMLCSDIYNSPQTGGVSILTRPYGRMLSSR